VWRVASAENKFDSANALLNEELRERIREAEQEWRNIDKDLLKILGAVSILELLAPGPLIASGHAYFLAAAVLLDAGMPVVNSTLKRRSFQDRFPAGFFMSGSLQQSASARAICLQGHYSAKRLPPD
jgi:hypothetical protein